MNSLKCIILVLFLIQTTAFCKSPDKEIEALEQVIEAQILPAADQPEVYLPLLEGKRVGLIVNQTSILTSKNNMHLVDFLMMEGVNVVKVFVPEHGFRGDADAGEVVNSEIDKSTGLPIISLYGDNKKPSASTLSDVDILIYDLQDVGVRFYTYISTMHYVMESTAENKKPLLIFDRPNPNGNYVDGPVLTKGFESFVGMHPIPVVHGLTVGELAQMINGEGWLKGRAKSDIQIIPVKNWNHSIPYGLQVKPSPNLPNDTAIRLYPSLCYFEGTDVSLGRGTYFPFQVYGYPDPKFGDFTFTPVSIDGMSKNPPQKGNKCYGKDLRNEPLDHQFTLQYLLEAYHISGKKEKFFNNFFDKLAGSDQLRKDIIAGKSEAEIKASWQKDLGIYTDLRKKYLLY
ncbi:exo-beta-N-acetylmuramidase NamZ domain-containing protein [Aquiflexum sp.]|uniref:exo-beta-N-acetylmuramidase NamZ family protein n=1 Tax=Aquiflexum sp. TaxID=1872584 RepID=UPI00359389C7